MQLTDVLKQSLRQFRTRRLESVLITVAVALGVGVVTAVAAFLDIGRQQQARFGDMLFSREISLQARADDYRAFFTPGSAPAPAREIGLASDEAVALTLDDLARAREAAPSVDYAYIQDFRGFSLPDDGGFVQAYAVTQDYLAAAEVQVTSGSLPSESDFAEGGRVMLATPGLVERLGLEGDPLGQEVAFGFNEERYTIIGLLSEPDPLEQGFSPDALVPFTPSPFGGVRELKFAVADAARLGEARAELEAFARGAWGERVSVSSNDFIGEFSSQWRLVSLVIAAFASTGLVVAALNIMNLMLARVLRRHREIGINRSLGASRGLVRGQFLAEALLLGVLGGTLGVVAGYGLLAAFNSFMQAMMAGQPALTGPALSLSLPAVLVGLALAVGVSLLFGLYPAVMASKVRIVEALREF
ncbi:MAG: ABC transporter permease [Deinococcota bacterium]|nr:ABC transporter permease [Deinococcota bacterium]